MTETTNRFFRLTRIVAVPALAAGLFLGGAGLASAGHETTEPTPAPVCDEENRADSILGGFLAGPLTDFFNLLPIDLVQECDPDQEDGF